MNGVGWKTWAGALCVVALAGCQGMQSQQQGEQASEETTKQTPVERGEYLVSILACNDCHTPWKMGPNGPEPDMTRMLSGHPQEFTVPPPPSPGDTPWIWSGLGTMTAFAGPWGISFAPNLTPDMETGLAVYTEEQFMQALRTGKSKGSGRTIMPPMPWPAYRNLTDEDMKAIFAYLMSIPPIKNKVPDYQPPAGAGQTSEGAPQQH